MISQQQVTVNTKQWTLVVSETNRLYLPPSNRQEVRFSRGTEASQPGSMGSTSSLTWLFSTSIKQILGEEFHNICLGSFFEHALPNSTIDCTQLVASLFHIVTGLGGLSLTSTTCILRISMWSRIESPWLDLSYIRLGCMFLNSSIWTSLYFLIFTSSTYFHTSSAGPFEFYQLKSIQIPFIHSPTENFQPITCSSPAFSSLWC